MGEASQIAIDAMMYVRELWPLLLILGGVAFADLVVHFLIRLMKSARGGMFK